MRNLAILALCIAKGLKPVAIERIHIIHRLCSQNRGIAVASVALAFVMGTIHHIAALGQTLEGVSLNGKRSDGHMMSYVKTGNNLYKVIVFSTENRPFNSNNGELLSFKVSGNGSIEVSNILFVTNGEAERMFPSLYAGTTGIDVTKTSDAMDVYNIDGRMVRRQVTSTNGLGKGMYIINGKKTIVK